MYVLDSALGGHFLKLQWSWCMRMNRSVVEGLDDNITVHATGSTAISVIAMLVQYLEYIQHL